MDRIPGRTDQYVLKALPAIVVKSYTYDIVIHTIVVTEHHDTFLSCVLEATQTISTGPFHGFPRSIEAITWRISWQRSPPSHLSHFINPSHLLFCAIQAELLTASLNIHWISRRSQQEVLFFLDDTFAKKYRLT